MPATPSHTAPPSGATAAPRHPAPPPPHYVPPSGGEIDLVDVLNVLARRWRRIFLVTLLGTCAALTYARLATPMYRAQATIAPPDRAGSGGASAALATFGGIGAEIAGSLGVSLGGADANRLEALLTSHRLMERVVTERDLLPVLFAEQWDPEGGTWAVAAPKDVPNIWDAEKAFNRIYSVENDSTTSVLKLSIEWKDAVEAERILKGFLAELAALMQEDELRKINANRRFAEEQLEKASDPVIVAKLQSLRSEQLEKAMMAQNVEHFAYELIDPPAASDKRVSPNLVLIAVLGLIASLLLGVLLALGAEWVQHLKSASLPANDPVGREIPS